LVMRDNFGVNIIDQDLSEEKGERIDQFSEVVGDLADTE